MLPLGPSAVAFQLPLMSAAKAASVNRIVEISRRFIMDHFTSGPAGKICFEVNLYFVGDAAQEWLELGSAGVYI